MDKYYDKLYSKRQIQIRGKDPIKDFDDLPVSKDFLAQKAKVLPYLITKLRGGDTSVCIIISKISKAGLNIIVDPKTSEKSKAEWLLNWWEKPEKEMIKEFKQYYERMLEEGYYFSSPYQTIKETDSGKKIMSLGIATLPYLVKEIENLESPSRDGVIMRVMIELLVDVKFSKEVDKEGKKLTNENLKKAVLKWWENNKEDWILKKNGRA